MTESTVRPIGSVISADLTVPQTESIRDFYKAVVGWESQEMEMSDDNGAYADYVMKDSAGNWFGGVCHPRGMNAALPPVWIVYIHVENVDTSVQKAIELGGKMIHSMNKEDGSLIFAIIQDPIGAVMGLMTA